jgi:hypothetical protein
MELETAKEILVEVFHARPSEVEEMIQRGLEKRRWHLDMGPKKMLVIAILPAFFAPYGSWASYTCIKLANLALKPLESLFQIHPFRSSFINNPRTLRDGFKESSFCKSI